MKKNTNPNKYVEVKACMATIAAHFLGEEFEEFLTENWERMEEEGIYGFEEIMNFYLHTNDYN